MFSSVEKLDGFVIGDFMLTLNTDWMANKQFDISVNQSFLQ